MLNRTRIEQIEVQLVEILLIESDNAVTDRIAFADHISFNDPGLGIVEEFIEPALAALFDRVLDLAHHGSFVRWPLHLAEDAQWGWKIRWPQAAEHKGQMRVFCFDVVDDKFILRDTVAEMDNFWCQTVHAQAHVLVFAKDHRLTMFESKNIIVLDLAVGDVIPGIIIEDQAVLEDLDKGGALVIGGPHAKWTAGGECAHRPSGR